MTGQEAFDRVWEWFVVQGRGPCAEPAAEPGGFPMVYHRRGNLRDSIGVLIPDELYQPAMEGGGVLGILRYYPKVAELLAGVPKPLLTALEAAHYQSAVRPLVKDEERSFAELIEDRLAGIAERFGLAVPQRHEGVFEAA